MNIKRRTRRLEKQRPPTDTGALLRYRAALRTYTRRKVKALFAGVPFTEEPPAASLLPRGTGKAFTPPTKAEAAIFRQQVKNRLSRLAPNDEQSDL